MKKLVFLSLTLCFFGGIVGIAHGTLIDQGGGLVYDDVLDITWLQDANLAATETFGVSDINSDGTMSWYTANAWIDAMNASSYLGCNDWRLPSFEINGTNELGYMFWVNMGGNGIDPLTGDQTVDEITLYDISWFPYLSNYETDDRAMTHSFAYGYTEPYEKIFTCNVWAVCPGKSPAPVPEPITVVLVGSGLIGLASLRRTFRKS